MSDITIYLRDPISAEADSAFGRAISLPLLRDMTINSINADASLVTDNREGWVIDTDGGSLWIPTGNVAAIYTETTT